MISFNVPPYVGTEEKYIAQAIKNKKICGDGPFTKRCQTWIEKRFNPLISFHYMLKNIYMGMNITCKPGFIMEK